SIKNKIRIVDIALPADFVSRFHGPNFGTAGIRALLGVYDRPLLATAIKPRGATVEHLASLARDFALGGGDIIKDDHNLIDVTADQFERRVAACQDAVRDANSQTGRNTLYFPALLPTVDQLERQVRFVLNLGIRGVLVCPFITGLDALRDLAERYALAFMAHPAWSGTFMHDREHGIAPAILLGKLLRLAGADASVYPNHGGRFSFTEEECLGIGQHLFEPLGNLKPALPVPAGGMRFDNLPSMTKMYGADAVFLIGGALLAHSDNLRDSTATFLRRLSEPFAPRLVEPQRDLTPDRAGHLSTCELPGADANARVLPHLPFNPDFTWDGRTPTLYKGTQELPFDNVTRTELLGKTGEPAAFDVRYFEIAPGGYTSLEKHQHIHAIICARGAGVLTLDDQHIALTPHDVAYTPPGAVHQLRNESAEPFGFFCIVDRHRDRPTAP
ncbi:MAG: cupin domain-containing protein, partial [Phycisphaerae bacterium]|nr:cupin domain-containing protein [Phycisphaerae bacterium]